MQDDAKKLLAFLEGLGESAKFVARGSVEPVLPGLSVTNVGAVGIPITVDAAQALIKEASQAPYGLGEKTIVDIDVRRVWQIEPNKFQLRNPAWNTFITSIVDSVKQEFGIEGPVDCQLYKLLVYEAGSFFSPHRDSEKSERMFATLVVCLPAWHEGGQLVVRHDAQTVNIDFSGPEAEFSIQYAAFYADCEHEILPITQGYRVCLIYNLALSGSTQQPRAPHSSPLVANAVKLLPRLFADDLRNKIAIPLAHQYTPAGMHPPDLKGVDRVRLEVLGRAAEELDYQAFLALLTHSQTGSTESDYGYSRYRHAKSGGRLARRHGRNF